MKNLILSLFCGVLILSVGCAGLQFDFGKTGNLTAKIMARNFGYKFAEKNPDAVPIVKTFAKGLQAGEITLDAVFLAEDKMQELIQNDPYLLQDLKELRLAVVVGDELDSGALDAALTGFLQGLE